MILCDSKNLLIAVVITRDEEFLEFKRTKDNEILSRNIGVSCIILQVQMFKSVRADRGSRFRSLLMEGNRVPSESDYSYVGSELLASSVQQSGLEMFPVPSFQLR